MQSGTFVRNLYQVFLYCQNTCVYTPSCCRRRKRGEGDVLSDGLSLSTTACGREGRVPLRNRMENAVTSRIFQTVWGTNVWRRWKFWSCRSWAFLSGHMPLPRGPCRDIQPVQPLSSRPRGDILRASPATALRQGQRVLQARAPPSALVLQLAWQLY